MKYAFHGPLTTTLATLPFKVYIKQQNQPAGSVEVVTVEF